MNLRAGTRRTAVAAVGALVLTAVLTSCGSSSSGGPGGSGDPTAALAAAKKNFDDASSVHFTMQTRSKPSKGDAVLGAEGTLTHQPAFKGSVKALYIGITADIPIVALDGKVFAKLPFSSGYAKINPSEYSAPDPASFADPVAGISGLLTKLQDAKKTGQTRNGSDILTTYSGTLAGSLVSPIIPSASESGSYRTVVGINKAGQITTLKVTGGFFSASGDVTYDLTFDDYGKDVTITAP